MLPIVPFWLPFRQPFNFGAVMAVDQIADIVEEPVCTLGYDVRDGLTSPRDELSPLFDMDPAQPVFIAQIVPSHSGTHPRLMTPDEGWE